MMTLRSTLLAATLLGVPAALQAQPIQGLYLAGAVGANFMSDASLTGGPGSGRLVAKAAGIGGYGAIGYGEGGGIRGELELTAFGNNVRPKIPGTTGGGNNGTYAAFLNIIYDIDLGLPVYPYIGVGGGYAFTNLASFTTTSSNAAFVARNGDYGSIAGQGIVGVAYPVTENLSVTAEYRGVVKGDERFVGGTLTSGGGKQSQSSYNVGNEFNSMVMVGLRYAFGAAPAPAPTPAAPVVVAPAPAPARSYLVFFDWDKADLTARAQQIIAEAAKNANAVKATKIDVAGHADKSGTPAYNQTLSLKRANNVAAELVRLGVPKSEIAITAYGDTRPLVPTAPGVREPQNRRVEIVLH